MIQSSAWVPFVVCLINLETHLQKIQVKTNSTLHTTNKYISSNHLNGPTILNKIVEKIVKRRFHFQTRISNDQNYNFSLPLPPSLAKTMMNCNFIFSVPKEQHCPGWTFQNGTANRRKQLTARGKTHGPFQKSD